MIPEDIQKLFIPVLSHRVELSAQASYRNINVLSTLEEIIRSEPVPPQKEKML